MHYTGLVQWTTKGDTIRLELLGDDQQVHAVELSSQCAGAIVAALAVESGRLNRENSDQQFIRPTGMQTAKTSEGEPVILMSLKGGTELPLVFKRESLAVLISELQGLQRTIQPGTEVRWN